MALLAVAGAPSPPRVPHARDFADQTLKSNAQWRERERERERENRPMGRTIPVSPPSFSALLNGAWSQFP